MMNMNDFHANSNAPATSLQHQQQREPPSSSSTNDLNMAAEFLNRMQQFQGTQDDENENTSALLNLLKTQHQQELQTMNTVAPFPMMNTSMGMGMCMGMGGSSSLANNNGLIGSSQQQMQMMNPNSNTHNFMLPQSLANNFSMANSMGMMNSMDSGLNQVGLNHNSVTNHVRASNNVQGQQGGGSGSPPNSSSRSDTSAFEKVDLGHSIAFRGSSSPPMNTHGNSSNFSSNNMGQQDSFMNKAGQFSQVLKSDSNNHQGSSGTSSSSNVKNSNLDSSLGGMASMNMNQMNSFLLQNNKNPSTTPSMFHAMLNQELNGSQMNKGSAAASFMDGSGAPSNNANTTSSGLSSMLNPTQMQQMMLMPQVAGLGAAATATTNTSAGQEDPGWEQQFKALRAYHLHTGNTRVPARFKPNPKLGRWVMTQRRQFTLLMQGLPSALTAERIRRLEELGFVWSVRPEPVTTWNEKLKQLNAYKATYGNCMVPQRYQANPQLGTWVHTQRRQYKLMTEGKKSSMTKEKVDALNALGFDWDAKHTTAHLLEKQNNERRNESSGSHRSTNGSGQEEQPGSPNVPMVVNIRS